MCDMMAIQVMSIRPSSNCDRPQRLIAPSMISAIDRPRSRGSCCRSLRLVAVQAIGLCQVAAVQHIHVVCLPPIAAGCDIPAPAGAGPDGSPADRRRL